MKKYILVLSLFIFTQLNAQLKVAGVFGDNAVLQQNSAIPIWGFAAPNAVVYVAFAGQKVSTKVGEDGRWRVQLQSMKADGKSYQLVVSSQQNVVTFSNVVIGEVWFASGQSNMAWKMSNGVERQEAEIKGANFPHIRFNTIDQVTSSQPMLDIPSKSWKICTPENVVEFSAVGYFFARTLHQERNVPVGIIVAARGATNLETWMSAERLATHPDFAQPMSPLDNDTARWNAKVRNSIQSEIDREKIASTSNVGIQQKVNSLKYNDQNWLKTDYPINMNKMGYPGFWGLVWVRKNVEIPENLVGKTWTLFLPIKDQNDRIYWNGKEVARGVAQLKTKEIVLPKGSVKRGRNLLAIRMYVHWGSAEVGNNETACYMISDKGERVELNGQWSHSNKIEPAVAQWQNYYNTNCVNYNAMIAPIIPYGIKGFLWYQGENNVSRYKQYAELQPLLIDDWRVRWGQGYLPFVFVQLANYKDRLLVPQEKDEWASFRDAQTSTLKRSQNCAMACAIDIGDGNDIHPKNKQEVGRRLYIAAKAVAYNEPSIFSGPQLKNVKQEGSKLEISFDFAKNGLKSRGDKPIEGFAICDEKGVWQWVKAEIEGSKIVIDSPNRITRVQYGWQSNPACNLYNYEGLPAVPFNVEVK